MKKRKKTTEAKKPTGRPGQPDPCTKELALGDSFFRVLTAEQMQRALMFWQDLTLRHGGR